VRWHLPSLLSSSSSSCLPSRAAGLGARGDRSARGVRGAAACQRCRSRRARHDSLVPCRLPGRLRCWHGRRCVPCSVLSRLTSRSGAPWQMPRSGCNACTKPKREACPASPYKGVGRLMRVQYIEWCYIYVLEGNGVEKMPSPVRSGGHVFFSTSPAVVVCACKMPSCPPCRWGGG